MTKAVRIENADTATYKVRVRVYDKVGLEPDPTKDTLVETHVLPYPTNLREQTIWSNRYLIVDEAP